MGYPRPGPCAPWCAGGDIAALPSIKAAAQKAGALLAAGQLEQICAESADAASEILYEASGRVFTGECGPVTVRPLARPTDIDTRSWGARLSPLGYFSSWGLCSSYGSSTPGVVSHYGCSNPPEVELGAYPVTEIIKVLIDGVLIPANEYELRDHRWLVRMRPTANFAPTERYGWPTCQINDLPDTEQGTFSVTFKYGQPAPTMGQVAARKLAEFLALPRLGDNTHYPRRVTSVNRQGVSAQIADVIDVLKFKQLGIYEVDVFLLAVNPTRNQRQAAVWSPDLGRPRRTANPS